MSIHRSYLRALGVLLLLLSLPAAAYLSPDVLVQRTRAASALSSELRDVAHRVAAALPRTATPDELDSRLQAEVGATLPLALRLYAAVAHCELRGRVLDAFQTRTDLLDASEDALDTYIEQCQEWIRVAPTGPLGDPLPPPQEGPPLDFSSDDKQIHVLRTLPRPGPGCSIERARMLLAAAQADLAAIKGMSGRTEGAFDEYVEQNRAWMRRLAELSRRVEKSSDAALEAECRGLQGK